MKHHPGCILPGGKSKQLTLLLGRVDWTIQCRTSVSWQILTFNLDPDRLQSPILRTNYSNTMMLPVDAEYRHPFSFHLLWFY